MKPGPKGAVAGEGADLLPDPNEDFLDGVVDVRIPNQPTGQRAHFGHVAAVQPLERLRITARRKGHVTVKLRGL
jgi:hypothetical protein